MKIPQTNKIQHESPRPTACRCNCNKFGVTKSQVSGASYRQVCRVRRGLSGPLAFKWADLFRCSLRLPGRWRPAAPTATRCFVHSGIEHSAIKSGKRNLDHVQVADSCAESKVPFAIVRYGALAPEPTRAKANTVLGTQGSLTQKDQVRP